MDNHNQECGQPASNAGGFFVGLLLGGAIGSGAMLLLAPQSGKKTRAQLRHQGLDLRDQVVETVEDAVTQARGQAHRITTGVQRQTRKLQQRGQDMLDEQKEAVSEFVDAEKTAAHNISSG